MSLPLLIIPTGHPCIIFHLLYFVNLVMVTSPCFQSFSLIYESIYTARLFLMWLIIPSVFLNFSLLCSGNECPFLKHFEIMKCSLNVITLIFLTFLLNVLTKYSREWYVLCFQSCIACTIGTSYWWSPSLVSILSTVEDDIFFQNYGDYGQNPE